MALDENGKPVPACPVINSWTKCAQKMSINSSNPSVDNFCSLQTVETNNVGNNSTCGPSEQKYVCIVSTKIPSGIRFYSCILKE